MGARLKSVGGISLCLAVVMAMEPSLVSGATLLSNDAVRKCHIRFDDAGNLLADDRKDCKFKILSSVSGKNQKKTAPD
jgi:hypothetical protein